MSLPLVHVNHPNLSRLLGGGRIGERVKLRRDSVGLVVLREPGKSTVQAAGTCTLISPDIVLTAGHVINFARQYMAAKFEGAAANDDTLLEVRFNVAFTRATAAKKTHTDPDKDLETRQPRYKVVKVEQLEDNLDSSATDDFALVRIARPEQASDGVFPQSIRTEEITSDPPPKPPDELPQSSLDYANHFRDKILSLQHPGGEPLQATHGPIKLLNQAKDNNSDPGPFHFLDMRSQRGGSGGPIYDDSGDAVSDAIIGILIGSSPKGRSSLLRIMPMDRIFRQSPLLRTIVGVPLP